MKVEKRKEELETFCGMLKDFYNDASDQLFPGVLENKKRGKQLDLKERWLKQDIKKSFLIVEI